MGCLTAPARREYFRAAARSSEDLMPTSRRILLAGLAASVHLSHPARASASATSAPRR
ncbi:hypothetical protein LRS73_27050 [Methylobacterium currus]|uniref:hypothetical protein n=1 Tax=Methylobacterium currus TaxID=2051553 RepID=UPI001E516AC4|nr:hypothetical protein [Methylobacterium currus]UHC16092.1 hypothetical protein LRS73_27050 [Methylobacterium currus]